VSTTATNYLNNINEGFPVKGQDNDSQGFRDNFLNIKRSLDTINEQVDDLEKYSIKTNSTATFLGNTIEDANLKNCTTELYNYEELQTAAIYIDYTLGSYQKFDLSAGVHEINVENWPGLYKAGNLRLSVTPNGNAATYLQFPSNYIDLGPQINPYSLTDGKANIFDLWSEEGSDTVFVKQINDYVFDANTVTQVLWGNQIKVGILGNQAESNTFTTGTNHVTKLSNGTSTSQLALVPNRIAKNLVSATESNPGWVSLTFADVSDIYQDAKFNLSFTSTIYTVNTVTTSTVLIVPNDFDVSSLTVGAPITIINPTFGNQPLVSTLAANAANTSTGSITNYKGSVYAAKNRLEVTYEHYGNNNTNTFVVTTPTDNKNVANTSTDLASVQFIHSVMPYGAIIMWYGSSATVPAGWNICDGTNGTPNLINSFIVSAGADYNDYLNSRLLPGTTITGTNANSGGQANIELIQHTHTATFAGSVLPDHVHSITDLEHQHISPTADCGTAVFGLDTGVSTDKFCDSDGVGPAGWYTSAVKTGIDGTNGSDGTALTPAGSVTVYNTGTNNGQYKNIPPFIAVYYIMKISGQHIVPTFS